MAKREFDAAAGVHRTVPAVRVENGSATAIAEQIAEEAPVALVYNGVPHVVVMATPANLDDLALGFSLTEGVIASAAELGGIEIVPEKSGYTIYLSVPADRVAAIAQRRRNMTARTGCGLCGAETIEQAMREVPKVALVDAIERKAVAKAMKQLPDMQTLNAATGAVHAAGWATSSGELQLVREDVGRHNALDKLIGALVAGKVDRTHGFAVVTSRASYEMVQKTAMAGIGLLAAVSAPTALAVRIARDAGLTLVGFTRGDRCVVYADDAHRLTMPGELEGMNIERLVRMANDIGNFFKAEPDHAQAVEGVASHIKRFWDPRMRKEILAYAEGGGEGMMELVREAVLKLR